ncbi:hypothetical protein F4803DRAFT_321705 [Xylaria telfairii]|nr:hypothetical protein F4803DRAFT_321705 [Xylaria telfairii]
MAMSSLQCYQAVRRHLRPHFDSIWVSDSLLASTFERYAATFRIGARYGSYVPGPMEHRKRLAKRHMGGLHFGQPHSAAPIWELANLVDLTQWQWKPPTSSDRRNRSNTNTPGMRALLDSMSSQLQPFFPPRADTTDDSHNRDEILFPQDVILPGVAEPLPSVAWDIGSTPRDVVRAALESLSWDMANGTRGFNLFSRFCDGWQQALADRLFQDEAIGQALTGIFDGLNAQLVHANDPKVADRLKIPLIEASITGISQGMTNQATSFDYVAWANILHEISTIQMNTIRVFGKAIACIPEQSLKEVSSGILANLDAFFNALGRITARPTLIRQTAKMAVPLKSLGQLELRFLLDSATQRVLGYSGVDGVNYENVRLSWLLLLARIPGVDVEYLAEVCNVLEADVTSRLLKAPEICQLFLVWTNSQVPLKEYARVHKVLNNKKATCFRRLGLRLWETGQYYRIKDFSKLLRAIGRENNIILITSFRRRGACTLANIAIGMRRPQAAIDILCLYEEGRRCKSSFWESALAFKALEILIWVPNFNFDMVRKVLRIVPNRQLKIRRLRKQLKGLDLNEITRIAAVGSVIGLSPYLTKRKAFSLMSNCYLNMHRHGTRIPRQFLRAFIHTIMRPLVDGQPGISSRLRYGLYIIQQQMGRTQALRIGMAMERRRKVNFENQRSGRRWSIPS